MVTEVQRLARQLLPRGRELADLVTAWVIDAVPEVAALGDPEAIEAVRESTEQNIGAVLAMLAFGAMPERVEPPPGTLRVVRQTLGSGGDLVSVLRAYHLGHSYLCRLWLDHVGREVADPALIHPVIGYTSERMFVYFDAACDHLRGRYPNDLQGAEGRPLDRRSAIDAVLSGADIRLAALQEALGYGLEQHHLGLVASPVGDDVDASVALLSLLESLPSHQRVVQAAGDGTCWAWVGFPVPPDERCLDRLAHTSVASIVVGVGEVGYGTDGFRRTHAQALDAERTSRLAPGRGATIARQRDVELATLLCADQERARRLVAARLGPLAVRDARGARLRATLRTYFGCGRSKAVTASCLRVHDKTVAYRIAQAEGLLGRDLDVETADLEAALLIDLTLHGD